MIITNKSHEFRRELTGAIRQTIAALPRGTIGISRDCLWQLAVSKISHCPNAPLGTNAAYFAREAFNAIVSEPPFNRFVY